MRPIQNLFQASDYPELLVGLGEPYDAAVWKLDEEHALVITTDFFTPVVDDPYDYGAIAAANALSDVYAMGGRPFLALNIAALPPDLPAEISAEILRGGAEKAREAEVVVAGGHTVQDKEPKYGLVVVGMADPKRLFTKKGARVGDALMITKPLGFGVVTTALKSALADPADVAEAVNWMKRLNRKACELAQEVGVRGATDITGFSLLGHGLEMANASQVGLELHLSQIPFLEGARKYAEEWIFPGGASDNRHFFQDRVSFAAQISEMEQMMLFDAQTSGGLLLAVPSEQVERILERGAQAGQPLWQIGKVVQGEGIEVVE